MEAEPPVGSRGKAPGHGVRGRSPPEVKSILKSRLQIFAVNCDENPTMSTLLFFLVHLYSFTDPESLNCHMQYFVRGVISAPFAFLLT